MRSIVVVVSLAFALSACSECSAPSTPAELGSAPPPPVAGDTIRRLDPPASAGAIGLTPVAADGQVIATWLEPAGGDGWRVRFARLDEATREWSEPSTVRESARVLAHWEDPPLPIRAPSGAYYVTLLEGPGVGEASSVHLARSPDGVHWTAEGTLHDDTTETEHGHAALAMEGAGVRAVWVDGREMATGGAMTLRTALVGADSSLTDERVLDPRVCECCQTTAVATTDGVLVAYRDRSDAEVRDIFSARRRGAGWTVPENVYPDGWTIRGCPVNGPSAAAFGDRVALAWYAAGETGARVRVAFSDEGSDRFGPPREVDGASPLGRVDVEWAGDGEVLVSWLGVGPGVGEATVRIARVSADGRVGSALDVARAEAGSASGFPRLAWLGRDMLVSWSEGGSPAHVRAASFRPDDVPSLASVPPSEPRAATALALGSGLPEVSLTDLEGHEVTLASMRGAPIVLSFFASWCEPCREEYPVLARLAREHGDRVHVVGVSLDPGDAGALAELVRTQHMDYTVLADRDGHASQVFGVPPIPATFVFDEQGRLTYRRVGGGGDLEAELRAAVTASL